MRHPLSIVVLSGLALAGAALPAAAETSGAAPAAETRQCISNFEIRSSRNGTSGYFVRVGNGWWRNRFECPIMDRTRGMVWISPIARKCRGDIVQISDFRTGIDYGGCVLGDWERVAGLPDEGPLRKPK
ncbi:hypothetical protein [Sandarakinorhabdus sp.]|uniref:hypothetical protein n=1 Tax=Sandarakinorhabdus sp. TaxID=1916663 RepID=UPI00286E01A9|nr:hypothetical protein [Sandarakinorhabdus sp.]